MTRACRFGLMALLLCGAAPALAGSEPLYRAPPAWVVPVELTGKQIAEAPAIVLADTQKRLDGGNVWEYRDFALRIDSPDTLNAAGTLSAAWLPDKGDLIVNRVEILRGGQAIDVLKDGAKFTVLRREAQLEQRSLDGLLTATLSVPGLRVGDVLRLAYTTVQGDQALGDKLQSLDALPAEPLQIGFARIRMSWPEGAAVKWQAGPDVSLAAPVAKNGFKTLEVMLPLPKRDDVPFDAPYRFRRAPLLQIGSFASWQDVSRTLAPHFATAGSIDPKGEIAEKIAGIEKQASDPLARATLALRLVQDEISYLANGLDGGNYLPQKPEQTWQLRYGDCKAKSLLLLAMLREMGISAEVVAVHSQAGDAAPLLLPMPADFDHMIVLAHIAGQDYWFDGTSSGSRLSNVAEVPPFKYALPITPEGADLVPMVQRPLTQPDRSLSLVLDQSAGIDMPALYTATIQLNGPVGASLRAWAIQPSEDAREKFVTSLVTSLVGEGDLLDYTLTYDDEAARATVTAHGMAKPQWQFERGIAHEYLPGLPASDFAFSADRARAAWKDIPVQMAGPYTFVTDLKVLLPLGGKGFETRGREVVDTEIAGATISRDSALSGGTLTVKEQLAATLTEVDPAAISAEKAKSARFGVGKLSLRAPEGVKRAWDYTTPADRKLLAPVEAAYAKLIAKDPKDAAPFLARAGFRSSLLDWTGALADVDQALALTPSSGTWFSRSSLLQQLGRPKEALAAVRSAFELDPTPENALQEAVAMGDYGEVKEALALVGDYENDLEGEAALVAVKAQLLGMAGKGDDGLALLEKSLAERPGDPQLLNNICWHMGTWQVGGDAMIAQCTKAVESGGWAPPVLDSRAMAYFRQGKLPEALADLNAALSAAPGLANSLYMRGIVRAGMGDKDGRKDIDQALRMSPSLKATYEKYGISAPAS
ncbi:MAG: DUF3857 domain-containing protein [Candidatus Andeanibacterium colombiense]|uniref:DUF3857 domain-containing protein n=1 Tax=Candidatus Andeanibacterium colombiense TaxID=3121345 RepID=A0AAJ6BQ30_9SPHN|nr:MAG: DUF3857 domain-containing protein [Sphingomonadaceae bacterium]